MATVARDRENDLDRVSDEAGQPRTGAGDDVMFDRCTAPEGQAVGEGAQPAVDHPPLIVPVHEEVLEATKRETDLGRVMVRKRVEDVPVEQTIEVEREHVSVERVAIDQPVESAPTPRQEGDTLVVPVVEEVLVTEKRLMLKEEVRVTRLRETEQVSIRDTVRREVVEVEERAEGDPANAEEDATRAAGELPLT